MNSFLAQLATLQREAAQAIAAAPDAAELMQMEKRYLGRKGTLTMLLKTLPSLPAQERSAAGKQANEAMRALQHAVATRRNTLTPSAGAADHAFRLALPPLREPHGTHHPLTQMQDRMIEIFRTMGYEVLDGPEIERARYNFDLLRIPEHHPARDLWDTFYVEHPQRATGPATPLLRTHVTALQLRVMEKRKPPIRYVSAGRIFRHEATDATHEADFFQFDGLAIDKGITFSDLLGTLEAFCIALFGSATEIKFQPSFFPFVEPGAELLMKGARGWMEMLGCGMVHPDVLRSMRVDPSVYSGFAFGMGIDRLAMYYHQIPDIRLSYQGDLRFLEQF